MLCDPAVGTIEVSGGLEIRVHPTPGADPDVLCDWILGPALALLAHQRGLLVLHAAVLSWQGAALAVAGESGAGKSTLALALCRAGCDLIADDQAIVRDDTTPALCLPTFPRLKASADATRALGYEVPVSERAAQLALGARYFRAEPVPLRRFFVLSDGDAIGSARLAPLEAMFAISRNSFLGAIVRDSDTEERHFRQCAALVAAVPVLRLTRPRRFARLEAVAAHVLEGFDGQAA
ncbi:MAG: hypothetical protein NTY38_04460 [Acidobacteria bacterium]|nr:hypothetical protein [Acidobacteriota bacterium]